MSYSSTGSANSNRNRVDLPPIRTVLGDQLALPRLPSAYSPHSASSRGSVYTPRWEAHDRDDMHQRESRLYTESREGQFKQPSRSRATTASASLSPHLGIDASLPPSLNPYRNAQSRPPTPSPLIRSPSYGHSDPQSPTSPDSRTTRPPWAHPILPHSAPPFTQPVPYYFGVLRTSTATGELISSPPITRLPNRARTASSSGSRTARVEDAVTARRHVCPVCHKRFPRPSSLITHQSVHDGSRPFACLYPPCTKRFSVASNMRRHFRKCHSKAGDDNTSPSPASEGDGEMESEEEVASSSRVVSGRSQVPRYSAKEDYPMDDDVDAHSH